jgi:hypothetical protein
MQKLNAGIFLSSSMKKMETLRFFCSKTHFKKMDLLIHFYLSRKNHVKIAEIFVLLYINAKSGIVCTQSKRISPHHFPGLKRFSLSHIIIIY